MEMNSQSNESNLDVTTAGVNPDAPLNPVNVLASPQDDGNLEQDEIC